MANKKKRVLVFAGSLRNDSFNRRLARVVAQELEKAGLEVTLADLREYRMPIYDGDAETTQGLPPEAKAFKQLVKDHDAFVIASPEYNGSFSALVKNIIDWGSRAEAGETPLAAFRGKSAGIVSTSPSARGGQRGLRHLRELLEMIGVKMAAPEVPIPSAMAAFDFGGELSRPEDRQRIHQFAEELAENLRREEAAA